MALRLLATIPVENLNRKPERLHFYAQDQQHSAQGEKPADQ